MRLCICIILLAIATSVFGATSEVVKPSLLIKPSLYGRILFFTSTGEVSPLTDATVLLFELDSTKAFSQASTKPVSQTRTDSRGFYSFYGLHPAVYRLQVLRNQEIGGGAIARITPGGTGLPDMAIDWNDPCRAEYGRGYAADYIRTKINVPWRANSGDWLRSARQAGWRTGTTPAPGAIAVFPQTAEVPYGHVAWVDSVDSGQRTFVVSQWNQPGPIDPGQKCWITVNFGRLTSARWRFGDPHILGFIYPGR